VSFDWAGASEVVWANILSCPAPFDYDKLTSSCSKFLSVCQLRCGAISNPLGWPMCKASRDGKHLICWLYCSVESIPKSREGLIWKRLQMHARHMCHRGWQQRPDPSRQAGAVAQLGTEEAKRLEVELEAIGDARYPGLDISGRWNGVAARVHLQPGGCLNRV
jgi:hypothetical protein